MSCMNRQLSSVFPRTSIGRFASLLSLSRNGRDYILGGNDFIEAFDNAQ